MNRKVTKYSKKTGKLLGEYPIDCEVEEMKDLFDIGADYEMVCKYPIKSPEQIVFFKAKGIPITNRSDFFVEVY